MPAPTPKVGRASMYATTPMAEFVAAPPASDWEAHVAGIVYVPHAGQEPCALWRLTQWLILGIRWRRRV